jgi:hypothetical protein
MTMLVRGVLARALGFGGLGFALATPLLCPAIRRGMVRGLGSAARRVGVLRARTAPDDGLECGAMQECTADTA